MGNTVRYSLRDSTTTQSIHYLPNTVYRSQRLYVFWFSSYFFGLPC